MHHQASNVNESYSSHPIIMGDNALTTTLHIAQMLGDGT